MHDLQCIFVEKFPYDFFHFLLIYLQVHLGRGIYIDPGTWERLLLLPTDSAFCKQLAVRMWGNEVLKERTLTGTLSNKAISKGGLKVQKALSPVKVSALSGKVINA